MRPSSGAMRSARSAWAMPPSTCPLCMSAIARKARASASSAGQGGPDDFRTSPPFQRAYRIALAQGGVAQRELRVELDGEPEHLLGPSIRLAGSVVEQLSPLEIESICLGTLARDALEHFPFAWLQRHLQCLDDAMGHFRLQAEQVLQGPIEPIRPERLPVRGAHELGRHADPVPRPADAAEQDVVHFQFTSQRPRWHGAVAINADVLARGDAQTAQT